MRYADGPVVEGSVHIAATPQRVWEVVSDIHLMPALSSELQSVEWLDEGTTAVGRAFRGRSSHPAAGEWSTTSRIVCCEESRTFGWDVEDPQNPSASWRFELTPSDGGTDLRQWARLGPGPSNLTTAIERMPEKEERIVAHRLREWQAGIDANLVAIKERAENP
ncbi:SRPBCC family protein [Pseudonocardia abyssalis]|uniref:SRPBCC family protein n=1 Tax=Pseudonocardia abyssalis TaxID=2792008 RepID=A0ABS6USW5_9PSEU|nr:SRPBCC family protein [Pseudonocardia abyssalis]MBW0116962.1 SRPBCC family protein [Pseudonocardia abyssalis]MBW0135272.1 SRPBCC family protein [Pseudonocardia abyssalis]